MKDKPAGSSPLDSEKMLFQAILDNAPLGIWFLGIDGRLQFVNNTFCNAVGISEERFLAAKHYVDVLPPEISASCLRSDEECMAQSGPHLSREQLPFVTAKSICSRSPRSKSGTRTASPWG